MTNPQSDTTYQNSSETMSNSEEMPEKCGWIKFSESKLVNLEKKILEVLKTSYRGWHVPIQHTNGNDAKIWTISMNTQSEKTPLVLLHGFGAAVGFWCLNLDELSEKRPVYAIDLLGFGRSSRPDFSSDGLEVEREFVESIEKWRKEVKLDEFILLGHSMGAHLATCYTISHPDRVKHLILADPWGFFEKTANFTPTLLQKIIFYPFTVINPLATVRATGPLGPWLVRKMRSDIANKYAGRLQDHEIITDYIYQCNSQNPTGESACHRMIKGFGMAKNPMVARVDKLRPDVPITVFHGERSWINGSAGDKLKELRPESYVRVEIIENSGHHVHADNPECFNHLVVDVCDATENEICNRIMESIDKSDEIVKDLEKLKENRIKTVKS